MRNSPYEWSHTSCERSNRSNCLWGIIRVFWAIIRCWLFPNIFSKQWPPFYLHPPPLYTARRNIKYLRYCEKSSLWVITCIMWAIKEIKIFLMSDHKGVLSDHKILIFSKYFQWAIATLLPTSTTIVYSREKYKVFMILWEIVLVSDHMHHVSDQTDRDFAYEWSQECFERSQDIDFFQIFSVSNSHPFTHIHHHCIQQGEM